MIYNTEKLSIERCPAIADNCLKFTFRGKFTKKDSLHASVSWERECSKHPSDTQFVIIWDCTQMTGFENSARNIWMETMYILEKNISKVIVISDSIIIRGASRLMLRIFSFESTVIKSENQVQKYLSKKKIALAI